MARINIEEQWWTDPRREALTKLIGDELMADGAAIRLWRLAQEYWKRNAEPIPNYVFEYVRFSSELVRAGLALVRGSSVYVRGSSNAFEWMIKNKEKASKAGLKSAESRKLKHGSAQPRSAPSAASEGPPELGPNKPRTKFNLAEPSSSSSLSSSSSSSNSNKEYIGRSDDRPDTHKYDFEEVYKSYPKRLGDQRKAKGLSVLKRSVKTQQDFEAFKKSVENYAIHVRREGKERTEFVKQFGTFANEIWREWIDINPLTTSIAPTLPRKSIAEILREEQL